MTPVILYKHMKDFVCQDTSRPVFQHIWFDGEYAIATNTHVLCAVKHKAEPHFETADGTPVELEYQYPDWKKVVLKDNEFDTKITLDSKVMDHLDTWIRLLKFIVQTTKKKKKGVKAAFHIHTICLERRGGKLLLYFLMTGGSIPVKAELLSGLPEDKDFRIYLNAKYLLYALNFIKDTDADSIDWVFRHPERAGRTELRAGDMRITICAILIRECQDDWGKKLTSFIEEKAKENTSAAKPETETNNLDFLD